MEINLFYNSNNVFQRENVFILCVCRSIQFFFVVILKLYILRSELVVQCSVFCLALQQQSGTYCSVERKISLETPFTHINRNVTFHEFFSILFKKQFVVTVENSQHNKSNDTTNFMRFLRTVCTTATSSNRNLYKSTFSKSFFDSWNFSGYLFFLIFTFIQHFRFVKGTMYLY